MIRYESVSKQYPDGTAAVHDLSLEAPDHCVGRSVQAMADAANAVSAGLTTSVLTNL
jgi:hypothetical protein